MRRLKRSRTLGKAFPDQVRSVKGRSKSAPEKDGWSFGEWGDSFLPHFQADQANQEPVSIWRLVLFSCILIIVFGGLLTRLFHLQVVQGADNRQLADSNRIQIRVIHAPRGVIYDRNGKVLAQNEPGFRLKKQIIGRDEALKLEADNDSRYHDLEIDSIRNYPLASASAHILGYVSEITEDEFKSGEYKDYKLGDRIGRAGVEETYERVLKGTDGAEIIEVDAQGAPKRAIRQIDPIPGQNLYLSVDADLQKQTYEALKTGVEKVGSCCGAVVGEDPQTGQVVALASYPSYDPNAFTHPNRSAEVTAAFQHPHSPLLNRVIGGTYPPGSTFKIASAFSGLGTGKITDKTLIEDTGIMALGPYTFANWYFSEYGKKEGLVDIVKALQRSNDIFFYQVGQQVGEDALGETAKQLGMGKKLGIDIPGESNGLIPNNQWKEDNIGQSWYPGDTLHMSIGQGYVLVTPLQILAQTAYVANNGKLIQPHLADRITGADGKLVKQFKIDPISKDLFKPHDLELVKRGLSLVPKNGGTAWPFFSFSIPTAGKTGTAEFGDPKNRTHAWYTAYAPEDNPQIVFTAIVEAGGEGSNAAAPIIKQIYTWYFNEDKKNIKSLDVYQIATEAARKLGE